MPQSHNSTLHCRSRLLLPRQVRGRACAGRSRPLPRTRIHRRAARLWLRVAFAVCLVERTCRYNSKARSGGQTVPRMMRDIAWRGIHTGSRGGRGCPRLRPFRLTRRALPTRPDYSGGVIRGQGLVDTARRAGLRYGRGRWWLAPRGRAVFVECGLAGVSALGDVRTTRQSRSAGTIGIQRAISPSASQAADGLFARFNGQPSNTCRCCATARRSPEPHRDQLVDHPPGPWRCRRFFQRRRRAAGAARLAG